MHRFKGLKYSRGKRNQDLVQVCGKDDFLRLCQIILKFTLAIGPPELQCC